jgi:hypothetical protein
MTDANERNRSDDLTDEIKRLEAIDARTMSDSEWTLHVQKIADAYWARRRAWEKEQNIPPVCHDDGSPV